MNFTPDYDPIFAMLAEASLTEWNREAVAVSFVKAVDRWTLGPKGDEKTYTILDVEMEGEIPFRHKIDIYGMVAAGNYQVVDWKTKLQGKLDDVWELRETRSRQKKLYVAALAERFGLGIFPVRYEVRGIVLDEDKPTFKTLTSFISRAEAENAVQELRDAAAMRDTLYDRSNDTWIKNEAGCRMFGPAYKCEFEPYCWEDVNLPLPGAEFVEKVTRPMSHSRVKEFLRCPERDRLMQIVDRPAEDDETSTSGPGTAFHKAMEMVYTQLRNHQMGSN